MFDLGSATAVFFLDFHRDRERERERERKRSVTPLLAEEGRMRLDQVYIASHRYLCYRCRFVFWMEGREGVAAAFPSLNAIGR